MQKNRYLRAEKAEKQFGTSFEDTPKPMLLFASVN